jgi:hypothetical protein
MEFTTSSGMVLDDDTIENMAKEWEDGTWQGHIGEVTMGRPKLYDEDLETVSFRLPVSRIAAIEAVAKRKGLSRSDFLRLAVDDALLTST